MASAASSVPESSFVILWAGEDPVLHSDLLQELDTAGIQFLDQSIGDDAVAPTADPLPIDWKPRFGFEVAVRSSDLKAAEQILERLLDREPEDVELPAVEPAAEETAAAGQSQASTLQLWSSNAPRLTQFLIDALGENEIPLRTEASGDTTIVFVPPAFEPRAREILREIIEATPPRNPAASPI
jgi:hypothetical protein